MNQVSWRLRTDFNKECHLFVDKLLTDYVVETYVCSCGEYSFIVKHQDQQIDYQCKNCKNVKFYDANFAWSNFSYFIEEHSNMNFTYEYKIKSMQRVIQSLYVIKIPHNIDFISQRVFYDEKPIYTMALTHTGKIEEQYLLQPSKQIRSTIKKNLIDYINNADLFNFPKREDTEITLEIAAFFLQNKHLKEFSFYYWDVIPKIEGKSLYIKEALLYIAGYPKVKSVKKAIYRHYIEQMENRDSFNPIEIETFCATIFDSNIIVKFLDLDTNQ